MKPGSVAVRAPAAVLVAMGALGALVARAPWAPGDLIGLAAMGAVLAWLGAGDAIRRAVGAPPGHGRGVRDVLLAAFLARALAALGLHFYPLLPELYLNDQDLYHSEALAILEAWLAGTAPTIEVRSLNVTVYSHLTAAVYLVVGPSPLTMKVLSALAGALSVRYVYLVTREIADARRARIVAWLVALWPSHVLWSSLSTRDPWVFCLATGTVYALVVWMRTGHASDWARAALFSLLTGAFRSHTGLMLALVLLAMSLTGVWRAATWRLRVPAVAVAALIIVGVVGALRGVYFFAFLEKLSPAILSQLRRGLAYGSSTFHADVAYASWLDVVAFAPVGVLHLLFAPFPWQVTNAAQAATAVENLVFGGLVLVALTRWPWVAGTPSGATLAVTLFVTVGVAAFGIVEGNLGTAFRHKMQFLPLLLALLSPAWPVGRPTAARPRADATWGGAAVVLPGAGGPRR